MAEKRIQIDYGALPSGGADIETLEVNVICHYGMGNDWRTFLKDSDGSTAQKDDFDMSLCSGSNSSRYLTYIAKKDCYVNGTEYKAGETFAYFYGMDSKITIWTIIAKGD